MILNNLNISYENILILSSISIVLIFAMIATFSDLKYYKIPNKLTFTLFLFGITINFIFSIIFKNSIMIINSIVLSIITFVLCYILWKIRLWGGGDVKLITAISSVLPIQPFLINHQILFSIYGVNFPVIAIYPFPLTIIFNSILISFPFLVLFILINYFNNNHFKNYFSNYFRHDFNNDFKYYKQEYNVNMESLCEFYSKNIINFKKWVLDNIRGKQLKSYNKILRMVIFIFIYVFLVFSLFRFGIIKNDNLFYVVFFGVFFSLISKFTSKILLKFKKIVKYGSKKQIKIEYLKEGMIIDKLVINSFNLNNMSSDVNLEYFLIKFNLKNEKNFYNISFKKNKNKYILTSKTAAGLSKQDLLLIKKLFNNDMIFNTVYIKLGLPFAPSIFIGLIFSIFIGDLSSILFKIINLFA